MGIRKIGELKGKKIVEGDKNLVKEINSVHIDDLGGAGFNPEDEIIIYYYGGTSGGITSVQIENITSGFLSPVYGAYPGLTSDRIAEFEITPVNIMNSNAEEEIVFTCNTEAYDPQFGIVYVPGSKYYASNSSRGV